MCITKRQVSFQGLRCTAIQSDLTKDGRTLNRCTLVDPVNGEIIGSLALIDDGGPGLPSLELGYNYRIEVYKEIAAGRG